MQHVRDLSRDLRLLSELVLAQPDLGEPSTGSSCSELQSAGEVVSELNPQEVEELAGLAHSNHVIMLAFEPLRQILKASGEKQAADVAEDELRRERMRIELALGFLREICSTLEEGGCPVIVIKSLDHWPDLGSDLDLYTDAAPAKVIDLMRSHFGATCAARSWGDRLANKWNFIVPGLHELVEVHSGRLGQTGEQTAITQSLSSRARESQVGEHVFRVPAPEDRIVISTLQRMYRHFYIRLCDIVDNARLLASGAVDVSYLHSLGLTAGLWDGIATYLTIISEYVGAYRGEGVALPSFVTRAAKFGADQVHYRRNFVRIPILPHSLTLYASELTKLLLKGELRNSLRLSLLPCLATAAALEQKVTGSDKGIW